MGETSRKEKNEQMGHGSDDSSGLISFRLCVKEEVMPVGHETTEKARYLKMCLFFLSRYSFGGLYKNPEVATEVRPVLSSILELCVCCASRL